MLFRAAITATFKGGSYSTKNVYSVTDFHIDSAMDTDTDSWQVTIGDLDNNLTALLNRDSEVRVAAYIEGDSKFGALHTGLADEIAWNDEGIMVINGRDFTSVAVDCKHPPARFKSTRPEKIVKKEAAEIGIGSNLRLTPTTQWPVFKQLATDGSESYWEFWYRLFRKRRMWMWAEPDGALVAAPLNYNQNPVYFFGDNTGLGKAYDKKNFIPVETMEWRANKQQRIAEVYVIGHRGDKVSFVQKEVDPTMKNWIKRPISIINSGTAHGPGEARFDAMEELFESKVGSTEITITVDNPKQIIRQDRMCFLNIATANVRGEFYVVGSRMIGNVASGFMQEVRLREKNYAISKRVPSDPQMITSPGAKAMYGANYDPNLIGPTNPEGSISQAAGQAIGGINPNAKGWGSYFVEATDLHHGPWPFALFLGTLLSICEHETHFRNIRYNGFSGPDYPGTENGKIPSIVAENAEYNKFVSRYANEPKYGRVAAPPGFDQWAVGPMQLYSPSFKEYADKISGTGIDELGGGRWIPRYNIIAAAYALRAKLKTEEQVLQPGNAAQAYSLIWQGVSDYGGSPKYGPEMRAIYDANFAQVMTEAVSSAQAAAKDKTQITIPQGSIAELQRQVLNNSRITLRSSAVAGDVKAGIVSPVILRALLAFANAGFDSLIWVFKTGHDYLTSGGTPSAHSFGRAMDIGNYRLGDATHRKAQQWWCDHAVQLGIKQVIGPDNDLCYDSSVGVSSTYYNAQTLREHDNHIHIGAPAA